MRLATTDEHGNAIALETLAENAVMFLPQPFSPQSSTKLQEDIMHARLIQVTTKPGHLKDCIKSLVEQGIPILKQQPGFVDAVGLTSDTERDQFVGLTIWKTKEDAERYANSQARQVLDSIKPFLQQEPTFRTFNLEASAIHNIGIGRATSSR
jgi:quinol monooxygenase YgiN